MIDVLETNWGKAIRLETKVAQIVRQQEIRGWRLDVPLIHKHLETLDAMTKELEDEIYAKVPPRKVVPANPTVDMPYRRDGKIKERVKAYGLEVCGPFSKVFWERINLDSETQTKEYLLSVGWKPTEWNYSSTTKERTSPKLTEESFEGMEDQTGKLISKRLTIVHRRRQLAGFLEALRPDGRIPAEANTIGTPTGRMTHRKVVNVPKAKDHVFFGKQMREVFIATEGMKLVDCDASGLELRCLAHYLNDPELTSIILSGDWHTRVWKTIDKYVATRDNSKNVFYAFMYGAQDEKLGSMSDMRPPGWTNTMVGAAIRASLLAGIPSLNNLLEGVKRASKRGYLIGLDGRKLYVRSKHSAFNTLLQGAGAVIMKVALCFQWDMICAEQLEAYQIGHQHDETICEAPPSVAERVGQLCRQSIIRAGEFLKLNCPLDGEYRIGDNWAQVH
jgi:DNA polymerase I